MSCDQKCWGLFDEIIFFAEVKVKIAVIVTENHYNVFFISVILGQKSRKQAMRYSKPTNVQDVLENSSLGKIMQKGILLQQLNEQLERLFPSQFKGFYRVANIAKNSLVIEVANAMVRQGLLFKQQELLAQIQQFQPQIQQLNFKVNPALLR